MNGDGGTAPAAAVRPTAPEVFLQHLTNEVNKQDVYEMIETQQHMYAFSSVFRIEDTGNIDNIDLHVEHPEKTLFLQHDVFLPWQISIFGEFFNFSCSIVKHTSRGYSIISSYSITLCMTMDFNQWVHMPWYVLCVYNYTCIYLIIGRASAFFSKKKFLWKKPFGLNNVVMISRTYLLRLSKVLATIPGYMN